MRVNSVKVLGISLAARRVREQENRPRDTAECKAPIMQEGEELSDAGRVHPQTHHI